MQTFVRFFGVLLLSFAIFSGCNENSTENSPVSSDQEALLKGSGPSASGQGRIVGTDRVFAFNATTRPDGTVKGEGTLNYTNSDVKIKFSIDCLSVNGNVAIMSGTVTNSKVFQDYVGGPCWFKVVDNGEGKNAPPDELTGFIFCDPSDLDPLCAQLTCGNDLGLGLNPIENGNIQVRE